MTFLFFRLLSTGALSSEFISRLGDSMKNISVVFILALVFGFATVSYGAGFSVQTSGAAALGQGNSVIAHGADPTSIYFNPALITNLTGTQFEVGTTLIAPSNKFISEATGQEIKAKHEAVFPTTLFVTHKFDDKFSAGVGLFQNFGLALDWGNTWEGRYLATKSELKTYTGNVVGAYKVAPWLSVAAGVDVVFLDAELNKMLNLSAMGVPDIEQKLKGTDTALGYNLGLVADINNDLAAGLTYRSRIKSTLDGDITHGIPPGMPALVSALLPNTPAKASINLPATASVGIAYKGLKPLTLEIGARWEGWSSFKDITITPDQPIAGMSMIVMPKNWKDSYSINAGLHYQLTDSIGLMAGIIHDKSAVPDSTLEPRVPDGGSNAYCLGIDFKNKNLSLSAAYNYQKIRSRTKNNAFDDNLLDGV